MSSPDGLAALAVDPVFAVFGRAARYWSPNLISEIDCIVIKVEPDVVLAGPANTRALGRSIIFEVRRSEVAQPARGGIFKLDADDYQVVSDPKSEDSERLVWSCTVVPIKP